VAKAAKACSHHDCPHLQPCPNPEHQRKPWQGSRRREQSRLSGWAQQRMAKAILVKYRGICHWCGKGGADEVDHVVPLAEGGADDMANRRPIHADPCHKIKTEQEAKRARAKD
jgi:5-methylcytosine-specific restriction endonuclease McrA